MQPCGENIGWGKPDRSQCKLLLQGTPSSYFLIVGTQLSALFSETVPIWLPLNKEVLAIPES